MTAFRGPDVATESKPEAILRKDYTPPDHWIDRTDLEFDLGEDGTTVRARLEIRRNEDRNPGDRPLELMGEELETRSVKIRSAPTNLPLTTRLRSQQSRELTASPLSRLRDWTVGLLRSRASGPP